MTVDKGIIIKNIYHMLVYAFKVLKQEEYRSINGEYFNNKEIYDLFAEILEKGISKQLRQGLYREYVPKQEELSVMRGKLNISDTLRLQSQRKQRVSCEFDDYSEDNIHNQILKSTLLLVVQTENIDKQRKKSLKNLLLFFDSVSIIDMKSVRWDKLIYQRNNKNYELLLNLCYFLYNGMIQTTEEGKYKLASFTDEQMHMLFQRFVFEYYKKTFKNIINVSAPTIKWYDDYDDSDPLIKLLPDMKTDIVLKKDNKILIIDTKYYTKVMTRNYSKSTLRSGHLYQIFSYVKNMEKSCSETVSGLLLYAKTDEDIFPDNRAKKSFLSTGNNISIRTLDLNQEFDIITVQLNNIVKDTFDIVLK